MRLLLVSLVLVLVSTPAFAQAPKVEAGKPFTAAATADGANTDNYDAVIDGTVVASQPVTNLVSGNITFAGLTAPARGIGHTLVIRARNVDGLFADSDPLLFDSVKGKPTKPGKPTITSGLVAAITKPFVMLADAVTGHGRSKGEQVLRVHFRDR